VPSSLNGHTTQINPQEARGLDHFGGRPPCMRRHVTHGMESTNTLHSVTITFVLYLCEDTVEPLSSHTDKTLHRTLFCFSHTHPLLQTYISVHYLNNFKLIITFA